MNKADLRFMTWMAHFCSPFGTELKRISVVSARLARRGFIALHERRATLTGIGWQALLRNGYVPTTDDGYELDQVLARVEAKS